MDGKAWLQSLCRCVNPAGVAAEVLPETRSQPANAPDR